VDDGSRDGTAALVTDRYVLPYGPDAVRLLRLHANAGKGAAVRKGVARARGEFVLMADADGATRAADVDFLLEALRAPGAVDDQGRGVAIGSRAHMEDGPEAEAAAAAAATGAGTEGAEANVAGGTAGSARPGDAAPGTGSPPAITGRVRRSGVRKLLSGGFHSLLSAVVGGHGIRDTQCGFKLFTREAARELFPPLHIERWAFDVELVYLAARNGIPMVVRGSGECDGDAEGR
jgi:dolichyl-phosphate beta-glucosyltransferase